MFNYFIFFVIITWKGIVGKTGECTFLSDGPSWHYYSERDRYNGMVL